MSNQNLPAEKDAELRLEIAHLLLVDIVGYSRLLADEQIEAVRQLNRVVRNCESFRAAEAQDKLIRLPTGDGMALIFFDTPEQPAQCALEISTALRTGAALQVRMGVHSGPVNRVTDVNDRSNIAGAGINIAQRVMDCGDAGHILLSKHVADDLAQYRTWRPFLNDLGECEVKHGIRLHLANLCKDGLGNCEVPSKLRRHGRWRPKKGQSDVRPIAPSRFPVLAVGVAFVLSLAAIGFSVWALYHRAPPSLAAKDVSEPTLAVAEKSISVLPFENLSDEKEGAYFADGIQDEILTDLAKLGDLKVISRTSVMQYREGKRNLREIAKALSVNYVLEGSVQRSGDRVRVSAQLIDARTDTHVWAEHYDRPVADVFAIQAEVAEKIVGQLQVKLSPTEKAAIERQPTSDLVAFDLYARAKDLIERAVFNLPRDEQLLEAIKLLNEAIHRDSRFAGAYYQLAHAHDQVYFLGGDHTPARLALAEGAIGELRNLRPDSPEAHLATAKHVYWCYRDYEAARRELAQVGNKLPNDPWPSLILGYMDRRQSRWQDSVHNLERALELDPRNFYILKQLAITYENIRRYPEAIALYDRALAIKADDASTLVSRAFLEMALQGTSAALGTTIDDVLARDPSAAPNIAGEWLTLALRERKVEQAQRALAVMPPDGCREETFPFPRSWCEGRVALLLGDASGAQRAFSKARQSIQQLMREQPDYPEAISVGGVIDAALGQKAAAISKGKRAAELVPIEKDSLVGARMVYYLALIYTLTGEKNLAIDQLEKSTHMPCGITYDDLLLEPQWDALRSDPRFPKLIGAVRPKT